MLQYSEQVKKRRQQHEKLFCYAFLLVVMAGCSNYDTYIETGMQSLKDENIVMQQCGLKAENRK